MKKTKFMLTGAGLDILRDSRAFPCAVCRSGVEANSISCSQCKLWVHKKCISIKGRLNLTPDYVCPRILDQARPIDGRPITQVEVDGTLFDVEASLCYLDDMLSAGGGYVPLLSLQDVLLPGESSENNFQY